MIYTIQNEFLTVRVEDGVFLLDVVMADEPEEQEAE